MERLSTDTDAGPQSSVGVGNVAQTTKALHEIQPSWTEDGHGVRGPQRVKQSEVAARPEPMTFGMPPGRKNFGSDTPSAGAITVTTEDASGYTPGTGVGTVTPVTVLTFDNTMFEIFDGGGGQCVVRLKVCDAECGATKCGDGEGCP